MTARLRVEIAVSLPAFDLSAAFETGESPLGLFGASGAGKTTILETIAGLRRGARGRIALDGDVWLDSAKGIDVPPEARGVGYVPQDSLLFPHRDVLGNVLAGRRRRRPAGSAAVVDPERVLALLDLSPLRARPVSALSGGERQRVALARALCSSPSLLLLDEPLASIDHDLRSRILHDLIAIRETFRAPTIHVTHDATEAAILCGEVAVLRRGRIVARGKPSRVFTEAGEGAGVDLAGYENVLEATLETAGGRPVARLATGHPLALGSAAGASQGARLLVGVRASDLMLALAGTEGLSARNVLPGRIAALREVADGVLVQVSLGEEAPPLAVLVTEAARGALSLHEGLDLRIVAKAQACRVLAIR